MEFWTRFLTLQAFTAITYHGPCQILCFSDGRCFVIKEKFLSASAQDILRQNDIPFVIQKTLWCDSNKSLPFMHTWYHFSFLAYLNIFSCHIFYLFSQYLTFIFLVYHSIKLSIIQRLFIQWISIQVLSSHFQPFYSISIISNLCLIVQFEEFIYL